MGKPVPLFLCYQRLRRRLQRLAEVCEDLPDRPRPRDERDQPDVAEAVRALKRKPLPTQAMSFAHAIREVSCERGFCVV